MTQLRPTLKRQSLTCLSPFASSTEAESSSCSLGGSSGSILDESVHRRRLQRQLRSSIRGCCRCCCSRDWPAASKQLQLVVVVSLAEESERSTRLLDSQPARQACAADNLCPAHPLRAARTAGLLHGEPGCVGRGERPAQRRTADCARRPPLRRTDDEPGRDFRGVSDGSFGLELVSVGQLSAEQQRWPLRAAHN